MKKWLKQKKFIALLIVALMIAGIVKHRAKISTVQPMPVLVKTSPVIQRSLPKEVQAIGSLVAQSVEVTPELGGHVEKILFKDGTFVKQGEPLVLLNDAVYKAKYESAKAKLIFSENNYKRTALLGKRGVMAQQAVDQAEADLKEKRAEADENEVMLKKMTLTAPFAGMTGKCKINPGDYVTSNQAIVTLTDTEHLRVEYNLPEQYLSLLKLGQTVSLSTTDYPGKIFVGKLSFISPTINTDNRSVSLYADVLNTDHHLAPGMFVNVLHSLGSMEHVLMVPARSLVPTLDGVQVYKMVDGKAYAVNIILGKRIEDFVQVTEGLAPGDIVITDGQLKLKNSMLVKATT